ncbi:tetratricopeptide repeat protein [Alicyclobacillus macrosporangiidus]|nr:tetratricopeptide repeat protein [Alicyclobacillus macrosporangiidus]
MGWTERLEWGKKLISQGLFHAALDHLHELEREASSPEPVWMGELYNELGKAYSFLTDYREAVSQFTKAISHALDRDGWAKYNVNLAYVYRRMSEFDTSYRYLSLVYEFVEELSPLQQGHLLLNLSAIHGLNGFYEQAIDCARRSLDAYSAANTHHYDARLYGNLGLAYRELGNYDKAERYLEIAMQLSGDRWIGVFPELGFVYLLQGELDKGLACAQRALRIVWSSLISYDKEDLAILCRFLAQIAKQSNKTQLAIRLAEKAQVFYGQIGMWRKWQDLDSEMTDLLQNSPPSNLIDGSALSFSEISTFLNCLDVVNSQEIIHKNISNLLDMRVHYTKLLATALRLSEQDQNDLVLAARFSDYGLTALESEVVLNPHRSPQAFEQYKQHPNLSVLMLRTFNLPERILDIVADHHENYDGTGFPMGKKQGEIHYLARVLAVVDKYVSRVVMDEMRHSEIVKEIVGQSGTVFDPTVVSAFRKLFEIDGMP